MVGILSSPEGRQHFEDKRSRRTDCGARGHHHSNHPNNSARCKLQALGFPVCPFLPSLSGMATLSVPGWRQLSLFPLTSKLPSSGGVHLLGMERDRAVLGNTWKTPTPSPSSPIRAETLQFSTYWKNCYLLKSPFMAQWIREESQLQSLNKRSFVPTPG